MPQRNDVAILTNYDQGKVEVLAYNYKYSSQRWPGVREGRMDDIKNLRRMVREREAELAVKERFAKVADAELARLRQFKAKAVNLAILIKNYPAKYKGALLFTLKDIKEEAADLLAERGKG